MPGARPYDEERAVAVFTEALRIPVAGRGDFLDQACRGNPALRDRVLTLLDALPDPEDFYGNGSRAGAGAAPSTADMHLAETTDAAARKAGPVRARVGMILGHYLIQELLGAGGMGEVYRAEDLALGRPAAVKLLRGGVDPHLRARFLKESSTSARIEHPAVATFYEHGHDQGLDYLAMEYVPGRTLRTVLEEGALEPGHAQALASALLDGLVHAHAKGIVHRDIKPENVVITAEGLPKLLDFGIAKELHLPRVRNEAVRTATMLTALTGHGFIVGTMGYMSPEQLQGRVVSEQTDLFAMGAVLYEMLAGEPAFPGRTGPQRMKATMQREIPFLELEGLSTDINAVLGRAMARDTRDRYPSATAFLRDLRDLGSGTGLAVLPNTVAIFDLENLGGPAEDDWIGSGVAESLGTDLGHQEGLELVPRNKVLRVAEGHRVEGEPPDPVDLGLVLGCRWVLGGTFQRLGSEVRLTVRFVEVATGRDLWVEELDGALDDLFAMQDRLVRLVAASLDLVLPSAPARMPDLSVHELYSQARPILLTQNAPHMTVARDKLEQALAIDPGFAPGLAGLAALQAPLGWYVTADPAMLDGCLDLAGRAIASDPGFAESYVWLGYAKWRKGRYAEAAAALEKAESLDGTDHLPAYFLGCLAMETADPERALVHLMRAAKLSPDNVFVLSSLANTHMVLDHLTEAEWTFRRAVELVRGGDAFQWGGPMQLLVACLVRQGRIDDAWELCREVLAEMEASAHAMRGFWRLGSLQLLAEIALLRGDGEAAAAAIGQAVAMLEAQPEGPTRGHTVIQLWALRSVILGNAADFRAAVELERSREGFDFSWGPRAFDDYTCWVLAKVARFHGEGAMAAAYLEQARTAGCRLDFPGDEWPDLGTPDPSVDPAADRN